jgi:hypothetical protein
LKNGYLLWKVFHSSSKFFSGSRLGMAATILYQSSDRITSDCPIADYDEHDLP